MISKVKGYERTKIEYVAEAVFETAISEKLCQFASIKTVPTCYSQPRQSGKTQKLVDWITYLQEVFPNDKIILVAPNYSVLMSLKGRLGNNKNVFGVYTYNMATFINGLDAQKYHLVVDECYSIFKDLWDKISIFQWKTSIGLGTLPVPETPIGETIYV